MVHETTHLSALVTRDEEGTITEVKFFTFSAGDELASAERSDHTDKGGGETFSWHAPELSTDHWYGPNMGHAIGGALSSACMVVDKQAERLGL